MFAFLTRFLFVLGSRFKSQAGLQAENVVLRQQLLVLNRKSLTRVRLRNIDRLILVWLYRLFLSTLDAIVIVKPATVLRWHRRGFRAYWRWKSWRRGGRPRTDRDIRDLIRRMCRENPLWGAPRIHGELLMLGIEVSESTVGRYMIRTRRARSQGWKTFLRNHAAGIAAIGLFVARTISFKLLYGLVILRHARRRLVTISVTANPTSEWIAGQVTEAFPWDEPPRHLNPRRRQHLRSGVHPSYSRDGDPRSSDRTALALAEQTFRAAHRIDPARMPGPRCGVWRGAPAQHPQSLRRLLQRDPHPSVARQRRSLLSMLTDSRCDRSDADPRWAPSSIRSGLVLTMDRWIRGGLAHHLQTWVPSSHRCLAFRRHRSPIVCAVLRGRSQPSGNFDL